MKFENQGAGDDGSKEEGVVNMKSIEVNHEAEHAYAEAEPEKKEVLAPISRDLFH